MDYTILNRAVKRRQHMLGKDSKPQPDDAEALHIAYGIDNAFVEPMGVAMVSIVENNPAERIVFHVLTESIEPENIEKLQQLADRYSMELYLHFIDGAIFDELPSTEHFTKATYNRFLLPKILQGQVKRVIYLDADILCTGSVGALRQLDFQGAAAAVVQDIGAVADRQIRKLGLKSGQYFNAGFIYMDVDLWNEAQISEKALEFSFENLGRLNWLDQDALNVVLENKALFIEEKYDYIFDFGLKANKNVRALPEGTVFVHYAGRYKPWHAWCMHPLRRDFLQHRENTPWKNAKLVQPANYKDMKKMARAYMAFGSFFQGLLWYGKYAYHKIISSF